LAGLQPQYDMAGPGAGPTPEPLPTSAVPGERVPIEPVIAAPSLAVENWSPDGAYLIFGLSAFSNAQSEVDLHFLEAATGAVCRASEPAWAAGERSDALRGHFAWLPASSQLAVSSSQGVSLVSVPDGETVAFWELAGGSGYWTRIVPSPNGKALAVVASGAGLYHISVPASD